MPYDYDYLRPGPPEEIKKKLRELATEGWEIVIRFAGVLWIKREIQPSPKNHNEDAIQQQYRHLNDS